MEGSAVMLLPLGSLSSCFASQVYPSDDSSESSDGSGSDLEAPLLLSTGAGSGGSPLGSPRGGGAGKMGSGGPFGSVSGALGGGFSGDLQEPLLSSGGSMGAAACKPVRIKGSSSSHHHPAQVGMCHHPSPTYVSQHESAQPAHPALHL